MIAFEFNDRYGFVPDEFSLACSIELVETIFERFSWLAILGCPVVAGVIPYSDSFGLWPLFILSSDDRIPFDEKD